MISNKKKNSKLSLLSGPKMLHLQKIITSNKKKNSKVVWLPQGPVIGLTIPPPHEVLALIKFTSLIF